MSTVQDRYAIAARRVMRQAGGDPAHAADLAAWGQRVHQADDGDARAIVSQDGQVVAEARRRGNGFVQADYVLDTQASRSYGVAGLEVSLATGRIARQLGQGVIVATVSDLAWTPYQRTDRPRDQEQWGVSQVADTLGVQPRTVSGYLARKQMPAPDGYLGRSPWWTPATIDTWAASRAGQGARTDLLDGATS